MKAKGILSLMLVTAMLLLALAGCSEGEKAGPAGTHKITDHLDIEVSVPDRIDRIVVCDIFPLPSVLTVFFDSAEKLVGIPSASLSAAKNGLLGELYPAILNAKTDFLNGSSVNMEELAALEPDVVFYSAGSSALGEQLRSAGFAAVAVSASKWQFDAIETLNRWILLFDQIFPGNGRADKVRAYADEALALVTERTKDIPENERQRAFFLFQYSDTTLMTSGFGQWWAETIGTVNVAAELPRSNTIPVTMEEIYRFDPSLIFITNFTKAVPDDLYENRIGSADWSELKAVKDRSVRKMPLGLYRSYTAGADTPVTLLWLAKQAYPDRFADIDITAEVVKYYRDAFGIELTDKQAASIFTPSVEAGDVVLH